MKLFKNYCYLVLLMAASLHAGEWKSLFNDNKLGVWLFLSSKGPNLHHVILVEYMDSVKNKKQKSIGRSLFVYLGSAWVVIGYFTIVCKIVKR